jgi:hypothetical protein
VNETALAWSLVLARNWNWQGLYFACCDTKLRQRYIEAGLVRVRDFDRVTFVEKYRRLICSSLPQSRKTAL